MAESVKNICRFRNLSVASFLILTISNIFLTIRLIQNAHCPRLPRPLQLIESSMTIEQITDVQQTSTQIEQTKSEDEEYYPFANLNFRLGRWDTSRTYKIFDYVVVGEKYVNVSDSYRVCLATQSSIDRIYPIVELAKQWTGPISLALFALDEEEVRFLQQYVLYLRSCHSEVRDRVTIHLVLRGDRIPPNGQAPLNIIESSYFNDCLMKPEEFLKKILNKRQTIIEQSRSKLPYPQNHMRNVARKACQKEYVFMTDVDIVPSNGFADSLNEFLENPDCPGGKCLYVVPTYELHSKVQFPNSKAEVVNLSKKGLARPFHKTIFIYNQLATNFTKWEATSNESEETHVSHSATNVGFGYEPFYIAPDTVPLHDERFVGYGFTRNTQVYETFVAGYKFLVLSPIFTCHWGLQTMRVRPGWRERQNSLNRRLFSGFKREIFAKYQKAQIKSIQM